MGASSRSRTSASSVAWSNGFARNALPGGTASLRVAGDEQGPERLQSVGELEPGHAGHHHVRDQGVDPAAVAGCERERVGGRRGGQDGVAGAGQDQLDELPDGGLVLAQQQRLVAAERGFVAVLNGLVGAVVGRCGEQDGEGGAEPRLRGDVHPPARLRDDPVHGREAEAGAEPDVLGRVEGLEDALERRGVDARPGVGDAQVDEALGRAGSRSRACRRRASRRGR